MSASEGAAIVEDYNSQGSYDHGIQCDGCTQNIIGTRYQCGSCPSFPTAYNLCSICEGESHVTHLKEHIFIKFKRKVDYPLERKHPLLPNLYKKSSERGLQISEKPGDLVHTSTYCDWCMLPIHGAWFRCVYCNRDMCGEHERLHHEYHVCIVLKAEVDYAQLSLILDLVVPDRSAPLIPAVYDSSRELTISQI